MVEVNVNSTDDRWWKRLPVSINCAYGDPLIRQQEQDTAEKLLRLQAEDHLAPYGFCTKGLLSKQGESLLSQIRRTPNLTFRYSLTGLDEGKYDWDSRIDTIQRLHAIFPNRIIISVRPIIPGRNDDEATLARILDVAAETSGIAIIGGIHDKNKHKQLAQRVDSFMRQYSESIGVKYFYKSSCSSAYLTGSPCWMHVDRRAPINLHRLTEIGIDFELVQDGEGCTRIQIARGTTGDINFIRSITASRPIITDLISNFNVISGSPRDLDIEHTSSWYVWARNLPQCLGCDYCIIDDISYLQRNRKNLGADPSEILAALDYGTVSVHQYKGGSYEAMPARSELGIQYEDIRIARECRTEYYRQQSETVSHTSA
ncbi:hypothetical protein [Nocardia vinacea]|uniref:hypothetical protein n=1 Tax=Nocardia vinacea TaxID=96468 RepID=UPI0002D78695|nr:hypothetical protein [Nocardia vinacea]